MLGVSQHRLNRLQPALDAFDRLLQLDPLHRQGRLAAVTVANALGLFDRALHHCHVLLAQDSADPQVMTGTGIVLEGLGRKTEALRYYERALALDSSWKDALINRGVLLLEMGDASAALRNYLQLQALYPAFPGAQVGVGKASLACGQYEVANAVFAKALAMQPNDGETLIHAGFAKALQEDFGAAQALLDRAQQVAPTLVRQYAQSIFPTEWGAKAGLDARSLYVLHHFERLEQCDWISRDRFVAVFGTLIEAASPPLRDRALGFRALALGLSPALQRKLAVQIAEGFSFSEEPELSKASSPLGQPLRIGYVSPSFRTHAVGLAIQGVFKLHDRKRVRVYAYAIGPSVNDPIRDEIKRSVDVWRDLGAVDDATAARRIVEDEIDVLIDLAGYVDYCRPGIFALRPAPVQVAGVDYPATRGAPWIDYLLLDPVSATVEVEEHCSERIIRLPHHMLPCSYADFQPEQPARHAVGLPDDAFVLAAFHNACKIDPGVFAVWMRVLHARVDACLWLLSGSAAMEANLKQEAREHGIDPARLIFAPRVAHREHLSRLTAADLVLDAVVCNGGVTVCDALVAGVPVLTCAGVTIAQRMAAGLVSAAGFPQGVTNNLQDYERRALEWVSNPEAIKVLRRKLSDARQEAPFFMVKDWVFQLESKLLAVYQRYLEDTPHMVARASFSRD